MSASGLLNGRRIAFAAVARNRAARTRDYSSPRSRLAQFGSAEVRLRTKLLAALGNLDLSSDTGRLLTRASFDSAPDGDVWMLFRSPHGVLGVAPRIFDGRVVAWLREDAPPDLLEVIDRLAAFEFVIAALERQCGGPLVPIGLGCGPIHRLRLDLLVAPGEPARHSLCIAIDADAASAWPSVTPAVTAVPWALRRLRVGCKMDIAGPRASRAEIGLLEVGDIIVAPSPSGGQWPALIRTRSAGPILSGWFDATHSRFTLRSWKAVPMEDIQPPSFEQAPGVSEPFSAGAIEDEMARDPPGAATPGDQIGPLLTGLPVQLQLSIGEFELSLGEVAALAPGAILDIPARGEDLCVNVMADKTRIATGRLVALGQAYGVLVETVGEGE